MAHNKNKDFIVVALTGHALTNTIELRRANNSKVMLEPLAFIMCSIYICNHSVSFLTLMYDRELFFINLKGHNITLCQIPRMT